MKTLISMVEFVLKQGYNPLQNDTECWIKTHKYAEFLKQPLEIWQFVPCKLVDGVWVVLEEQIKPLREDYWSDNDSVFSGELFSFNYKKWKEFQEAKARCIFEGFEIIHKDKFRITIQANFLQLDYNVMNDCFENYNTIEDLVKYNLELTPTGLKDSGYE